jgi:beta-N-acetylhexosaminidase
MTRALITGLSGPTLTPYEHDFLRDLEPWGLILFARNVENPEQVRRLVERFREAVGRDDAPVLIDQEGGRVQRLRPPHWPIYPPGAAFGQLYDHDPNDALTAARLGARLIAADLLELGITVDCAPVADLPVPGADPVIGDRAYGAAPDKVAAIAGAIADGLREGGVLPVVKHIPGHGRAVADSHVRLPAVDADRTALETTDFQVFRALAHLPIAMTAHVVFTRIDPLKPATTSATMVREVIRGTIGFDGLLMSDDISMGALWGTIEERGRAAIAAGCDVLLHCNARFDEMRALAATAPKLEGESRRRAMAALACRRPPVTFDRRAAHARFSALLAGGRPSDVGLLAS